MVEILPEVPSFGTSFARAFGGGLSNGISKGLEDFYKKKKEQEALLKKNKGRVRSSVKNQLNLYDKNKFFSSNPEQISQLEELTHKYVDKGYDPDEASTLAYQDILSRSSSADEQPQEMSFFDKLKKGDPALQEKYGDLFGDTAFGNTAIALGKMGRGAVSQILDPVHSLISKKNQTQQHLFDKLKGRETPQQKDHKSLTERLDELTGGILKPSDSFQKVLAEGTPFGPPGLIGSLAEETLNQLRTPESVQHAGNIISMILAHKIPGLSGIASRAEKISSATGKNTEEILTRAVESSGVDLERIAVGDVESINRLKNEVNKIKETPKSVFNAKAVEKERKVFGEKLPESPLAEYYEVEARSAEKEASKKPETKARHQEIKVRLAPEEKRLFEDLSNQKDQLKRIQKERLRPKDTQAVERVNSLYEYQLKKLSDTTEQLKNIQYEMKYGRPRPTEAEIDKGIENALKKYEEGIKNPTEANQKALANQLESDKKYIDRAESLIKRGELPGELRPDTFIKMKSKYMKAYEEAISEAKKSASELRGAKDKESIKTLHNHNEFIKTLGDRVKRLKADIVNQTDKIKSLKALERPSGAFYKNQINSLKKDEALFKNDLFKHKRIKGKEEFTTGKVFDKGKTQMQEGKNLIENPSQENIKQIAQEAGVEQSKIADPIKKLKQESREMFGQVKKGTVTPKTEKKLYVGLRYFAKHLGGGFAVGVLEGLSEEYLGFNPSSRTVRGVSTALKFGSYGSTSFGKGAVRLFFDTAQAKELKKLQKDPKAWNAYVNNMEKKYGHAKVNRVFKIMKEEDLK